MLEKDFQQKAISRCDFARELIPVLMTKFAYFGGEGKDKDLTTPSTAYALNLHEFVCLSVFSY